MSIRFPLALLICGLAVGCAPHQPAPPVTGGASVGTSPCLSGTRPPPGIIVGFGQGADMREARQRAYAHISEQISVQVHSQSEATAQKNNAELQASFQQSITSSSQAQLGDLELECLDQHSTPGQVYLSYRYDQRALATRITDKLADALGYLPAEVRWQGPVAMAKSHLLTRINQELALRNGSGNPALAVELSWRSAEQNWLLALGDLPVTLTPAQLQLVVGWQALAHGKAELAPVSLQGTLQTPQMLAGMEYRLALRHPRGGYAQLIGIYENGDLDLLRSNVKLAADQVLIVPETGGVFEAGLLDGKSTTDTFLLLVTPDPLASRELPSLNRRSDGLQLQSFLLELEALQAESALVQLLVQE